MIKLGKLLRTYTFDIELVNNNDGRGHSFWRTNTTRKAIEKYLYLCGGHLHKFNCKVDLIITRILGKKQRLWDADSILRGNAKELIDSLVAIGWFVDDGPEWIGTVIGQQFDPAVRGKPATKIEVYQCVEP